MATKIEGDVKRSEMFMAAPQDIAPRPDRRARKCLPSKDALIALATDIFDSPHGQIQPCSVRKIAGNRLEMIAGETRRQAVEMIREGFTGADGKQRQDPEYRLKCVLTQVDDKQAFLTAIQENNNRSATSPVDDAFNQEELRNKYGWSDAEIARFYGYPDASRVSKLKKLLTLPDATLMKLHNEQISFNVAQKLSEVPAEHHEAITAPSEDGKPVTVAEVRERVAEIKAAAADSDETDFDATNDMADGSEDKPRKGKPAKQEQRTIKQVRLLIERYCDDQTNIVTRVFAKKLLEYLKGECSVQDVEDIVKQIEGGPTHPGKYEADTVG